MVCAQNIIHGGINVKKINSTDTRTKKPGSSTHPIVKKQEKQSKHVIDLEVEALDFGISHPNQNIPSRLCQNAGR